MDYPMFPCGDCAATLQIGDRICEEVNRTVVSVMRALQQAAIPGVRELVPSYGAVCIHYDPELLSYDALQNRIRQISTQQPVQGGGNDRPAVRIPVCYGGDYGPDLAFVAEHSGLTPEEVVHRHSAGQYLVYMLGFLPGFAYMGGMDESIACPRLTSPRSRIPAGSVGIAGSQTGIYPLASPGGWQLIGRTPVRLFSIEGTHSTFALSAGDRVQFVPVSPEEYRKLEAGV